MLKLKEIDEVKSKKFFFRHQHENDEEKWEKHFFFGSLER